MIKEEIEEAHLDREKRSETNKGQHKPERATVVGAWLTVVPDLLNVTTLLTEEFRDNPRLRFSLQP